MKISVDQPDVPPKEPVPCGHPCTQIFWEIAKWDDILVENIKRYTFLNYTPSDLVSTDPIPVVAEDYYIKEGSDCDIQSTNIPVELKKVITEYFGVSKRKGFLYDYQRCVYPCSCVLDERTRSNEGQEEQTIELELQYEERRWMYTHGVPHGDIPTLDELVDPRTGKRPTGFDNETDEIKKGHKGFHGDQRWDIVRTYLAIVKLKIQFAVILYMGTCINLDEVI